MLTRLALLLCIAGSLSSVARSQALPTVARRADLQIGAGYVDGNSDYDPQRLKGFAAYATLDVKRNFGAEIVVHQIKSSTGDNIYERTYEIGPRYHRDYGLFAPYIKVLYGRGVFNFPNDVTNLAYNIFSAGVGVDIKLRPYLNVRGDYEYQKWLTFPPTGLTPQLITIGVAYHFPGDIRRSQHY